MSRNSEPFLDKYFEADVHRGQKITKSHLNNLAGRASMLLSEIEYSSSTINASIPNISDSMKNSLAAIYKKIDTAEDMLAWDGNSCYFNKSGYFSTDVNGKNAPDNFGNYSGAADCPGNHYGDNTNVFTSNHGYDSSAESGYNSGKETGVKGDHAAY